MTLVDLKDNWQKYGLNIQGTIIPLKDRFVICWGPMPDIPDALLFDTGGEQGAPSFALKVNGDDLISVNPMNPTETTVLGKLVLLENS